MMTLAHTLQRLRSIRASTTRDLQAMALDAAIVHLAKLNEETRLQRIRIAHLEKALSLSQRRATEIDKARRKGNARTKALVTAFRRIVNPAYEVAVAAEIEIRAEDIDIATLAAELSRAATDNSAEIQTDCPDTPELSQNVPPIVPPNVPGNPPSP